MRRRLRLAVLIEQSVRSRYFESALPALARGGAEVVLLTVAPRGALHGRLEEAGVAADSLESGGARSYLAATMKLAKYIRRHDLDLMHCHEPIPGAIGSAACRLTGRPSLLHRHHSNTVGPGRPLSRLASRMAEVTVAVSAAAARAAVEVDGVHPDGVRVCHNGVPAPRPVSAAELRRLRAALDIGTDVPVIMAVAHMRREKGLDLLLEAWPACRDRLPNAHLVLVGAGPELLALRRQARSMPLEGVHFVGHQDDVDPWYRLAGVVVIPSREEAFGLVAIEAFAAGTPVIAAPVGGLPEVVEHEKSGLLANPGDPVALADAVYRIHANRSFASDLSTYSRQRYQATFTTEAMVKRWEDAYAMIVDRPDRDVSRGGRDAVPRLPATRLSPHLLEHRARYRFAATFVREGAVLDVGCGSGYGAGMLLAAGAARVVAVDTSADAIAATIAQRLPALEVLHVDGVTLPFPDGTFDVITCFETIEHVADPSRLLAEVGRVMRSDGLLLLSTPNALHTAPNGGIPANPYHLCEWEPAELARLLDDTFKDVQLLAQRPHPRFRPCPYWERREMLPTSLSGRAQVLAWKLAVRLPNNFGDAVWRTVRGTPLIPGETGFVFEPDDPRTGHVLIAICRR